MLLPSVAICLLILLARWRTQASFIWIIYTTEHCLSFQGIFVRIIISTEPCISFQGLLATWWPSGGGERWTWTDFDLGRVLRSGVFFGNISNEVLIANCNANMVLRCFFLNLKRSFNFNCKLQCQYGAQEFFLNFSNEVLIQIANSNAKEENVAWGKLQLARDEESVEKKKLIQLQVILEI